MITPAIVIASARKLLGVKYGHQGRVRFVDGQVVGSCVDCAGNLIFVGHDTGVSEFDALGYSPDPDGATFERMLSENLVKLVDKFTAQPADILAFDYGKGIQHVAIVTAVTEARRDWRRYTIIHATRANDVHEAAMGWALQKLFVAAYRLPELATGDE